MIEESGQFGIEQSKLPAGIDDVTEKYTLAGGEDWADAIDRCIAHDADNRFQNGHQMREEAIRVGLILQ